MPDVCNVYMCSVFKMVVDNDSSVKVQNLSGVGDRAKDMAVVALVVDAICMRHYNCYQNLKSVDKCRPACADSVSSLVCGYE